MANITSANNELPEEINPTENKTVEIKQLDDADGDFYPKTHVNAVDGMEKYDDGIISLNNELYDYVNTNIYDTGWVDYKNSIHVDVVPNGLYASDGFSCGLRQVTHYYGAEEVKTVTRKMIRVNMRNFANGQQIALLPSGFMTNTQVFYSRSGSGRQPIMVEIRGNGAMFVYIDSANQSGSTNNNWIYAQFEWTE